MAQRLFIFFLLHVGISPSNPCTKLLHEVYGYSKSLVKPLAIASKDNVNRRKGRLIPKGELSQCFIGGRKITHRICFGRAEVTGNGMNSHERKQNNTW